MANVKYKINIDLKKAFRKISTQTTVYIANDTKEQVLSFIKKGISPVEGFGRYEKYSDSYKDQIQGKVSFRTFKNPKRVVALEPLQADKIKFAGKKIRPVNLKLSGKLHKSLESKVSKSGVRIVFKNKVAKYHNNGTDKMPRRAMLPKKGEELSRRIQKKMQKKIEQIIKKNL